MARNVMKHTIHGNTFTSKMSVFYYGQYPPLLKSLLQKTSKQFCSISRGGGPQRVF